MTDTLEDLARRVAAAQSLLEQAEARLGGRVAVREQAYARFLESPDDEDHGERLANAKAAEMLARERVEAHEKNLQRARDALKVASDARDRDEMAAIMLSLARRSYDLAGVVALRLRLDELVAALDAQNAAFRADHDRAAVLARNVGDVTFSARCAKPTANEARTLARIACADALASDSGAHEAITPWESPSWNDPAIEVYRHARRVLENGAKQ